MSLQAVISEQQFSRGDDVTLHTEPEAGGSVWGGSHLSHHAGLLLLTGRGLQAVVYLRCCWDNQAPTTRLSGGGGVFSSRIQMTSGRK